jgi:hypothetical protein
MAVEDWNEDDDLNGTLEGVNVAEGSLPADFNDMFRKMAASIKTFFLKSYRKTESVRIQATGGSLPTTGLSENDICIEYIP